MNINGIEYSASESESHFVIARHDGAFLVCESRNEEEWTHTPPGDISCAQVFWSESDAARCCGLGHEVLTIARATKENAVNDLNENERLVIDAINEHGEDFADRMSICASELPALTGLTPHQIAGYISDLDRKEIIIECEFPNRVMGWQII